MARQDNWTSYAPAHLSMQGATPLTMPVTRPSTKNWTIDDYRNSAMPQGYPVANNTYGYTPSAVSRPASAPAYSGGNSSAAYTPRLNSQGALPASGSLSWNRPSSSASGYAPSLAAMNTGGYSTAMGAAVTGLPVYNQMGQQVSNSGGGMPAYGSGPFVKNGNTYTPDGNGGYTVTAGASAMPAQQPQQTAAQRLFADVQNQANTAKAANEQRYDAILNRDQAAITPDFLAWLKEKNPRAAKDINVLNKMVADPKNQEAYRATDRFASFGGYRDRYTRGVNNLKGWGQQQLADNAEDWQKTSNNAQMSLAKKGLLGSTVGSNVRAGMQREMSKDARRIQEDIQMRNFNADKELSGDTLQFMERRNDTYPDQMALAGLAQNLGLLGGGTGGGGGNFGGGMPTLQYSGTYSRNGMPARGFGAPSYRGF